MPSFVKCIFFQICFPALFWWSTDSWVYLGWHVTGGADDKEQCDDSWTHSTSINVFFLRFNSFVKAISSMIINWSCTKYVSETLVKTRGALLTYRLNHNTLLLLDVEHHVAVERGWSRLVRSEPDQDNDSPVLLCLLDVLKVGLALVGNGNSGRLQIWVKVSAYPLHCHQLTMVSFFGLSLVFYLGSPHCSCSLAANYFRWFVRRRGRAPPVSSCHTPITAQNLVWPAFGKIVLSPWEIKIIMTSFSKACREG